MENNNKSNEKDPLSDPDKKKPKKNYGKLLILLIIIAIIIDSYTYIYEIMFKSLTSKNTTIIVSLIAIFTLILILLLWCFITAMNTNPGDIPLYWGFYIGDDDFKRKRYCLICNAFKPERSHHCSVCNKCVLNMDLSTKKLNIISGNYITLELCLFAMSLLWFLVLLLLDFSNFIFI